MLERMLLMVFALLVLPAHAGTIFYSDSGTFSGPTPSTAFSGPSQAWAFSFQADTNPAVLEFGNGGFDFAFSNFNYSLNGSTVAITPTSIRFFTAANGGAFFICFGPPACGMGVFPNGLGTGGPQLYSGPNSAPTLLPGPFIALQFAVSVNSVAYNQVDTTLQAVATPEPATLLTLAVGLLALGGRHLIWRGYRRGRSAPGVLRAIVAVPALAPPRPLPPA